MILSKNALKQTGKYICVKRSFLYLPLSCPSVPLWHGLPHSFLSRSFSLCAALFFPSFTAVSLFRRKCDEFNKEIADFCFHRPLCSHAPAHQLTPNCWIQPDVIWNIPSIHLKSITMMLMKHLLMSTLTLNALRRSSPNTIRCLQKREEPVMHDWLVDQQD